MVEKLIDKTIHLGIAFPTIFLDFASNSKRHRWKNYRTKDVQEGGFMTVEFRMHLSQEKSRNHTSKYISKTTQKGRDDVI